MRTTRLPWVVPSGYRLSQRWPPAEPLPAVALFRTADMGESASVAARDGFLTGAASAVRLLVAAFDVDTVVLSCGLSSLGERLLSGIGRTFAEWSASSFHRLAAAARTDVFTRSRGIVSCRASGHHGGVPGPLRIPAPFRRGFRHRGLQRGDIE